MKPDPVAPERLQSIPGRRSQVAERSGRVEHIARGLTGKRRNRLFLYDPYVAILSEET